jgi:hypothetical protein
VGNLAHFVPFILTKINSSSPPLLYLLFVALREAIARTALSATENESPPILPHLAAIASVCASKSDSADEGLKMSELSCCVVLHFFLFLPSLCRIAPPSRPSALPNQRVQMKVCLRFKLKGMNPVCFLFLLPSCCRTSLRAHFSALRNLTVSVSAFLFGSLLPFASPCSVPFFFLLSFLFSICSLPCFLFP